MHATPTTERIVALLIIGVNMGFMAMDTQGYYGEIVTAKQKLFYSPELFKIELKSLSANSGSL